MPTLLNATYRYTNAEVAAAAGHPTLTAFAVANFDSVEGRWNLQLVDPSGTPPTDTAGVSDPDVTAVSVSFTVDDLAALAGITATTVSAINHDSNTGETLVTFVA